VSVEGVTSEYDACKKVPSKVLRSHMRDGQWDGPRYGNNGMQTVRGRLYLGESRSCPGAQRPHWFTQWYIQCSIGSIDGEGVIGRRLLLSQARSMVCGWYVVTGDVGQARGLTPCSSICK